MLGGSESCQSNLLAALIYFGLDFSLSNWSHNILWFMSPTTCWASTGYLNRERCDWRRKKDIHLSRTETGASWTIVQLHSFCFKEKEERKSETHPSAPLCLEERLLRRRPDGRCPRTPCLGLRSPCAQSSSRGWWWTAESLWPLIFLGKDYQNQAAEEH